MNLLSNSIPNTLVPIIIGLALLGATYCGYKLYFIFKFCVKRFARVYKVETRLGRTENDTCYKIYYAYNNEDKSQNSELMREYILSDSNFNENNEDMEDMEEQNIYSEVENIKDIIVSPKGCSQKQKQEGDVCYIYVNPVKPQQVYTEEDKKVFIWGIVITLICVVVLFLTKYVSFGG